MSTCGKQLAYHYFPDDQHFTQMDLSRWLPRLKSLGARWLILRASPLRAVPEFFLRRLLEEGIQPVIHIPLPIQAPPLDNLSTLLTSYAQWGVEYVVLFDRPNLRASWQQGQWARRELVERYMDFLLPVLQMVHSMGMHPTLPPLEPGGDYWDTAFLEASIISLLRRGQHGLLNALTVAAYAWASDRPLDWGKGGPQRWPNSHPYLTPEGSQDHRGIFIFDWYEEICQRLLSRTVPLLIIAGGYLPQAADDDKSMQDRQMMRNLEILHLLSHGQFPDYVLNFPFYLLACGASHPDAQAAWFAEGGSPRPVATAFTERLATPTLVQEPPPNKALQHYVLLPDPAASDLRSQWPSLADFAIAMRPSIGFSPAEARQAREVTILADEGSISPAIENDLRSAGCFVRRMMQLPGDGKTIARQHPIAQISADAGQSQIGATP
jgi:hypothetical protein